MSCPLVSIIVPIYNSAKYLSKCVDSLINQYYTNIQIVLVNDGSTDNSETICKQYVVSDSRVTYIEKENGGVSDARNVGLDNSKGEIIAFVDPDDWIDLHAIEESVKVLLDDNSDIVTFGVNYINEDGEKIRKAVAKAKECLETEEAMKEFLNYNKIKQQVWDKIYKKSIINGIRFEKGRAIEDVFWVHQILGEAKRISVIASAYYYYLQRSDSVMGKGYSTKWLDILDALRQRCDYIEDRFPGLYNEALRLYIRTCMYHTQLSLRANLEQRFIEKNILSRISFYKTGNIYENESFRSRIWLFGFVHFPLLTCKFRNKLEIGL